MRRWAARDVQTLRTSDPRPHSPNYGRVCFSNNVAGATLAGIRMPKRRATFRLETILGSLGVWRCTIRRAITNAAAFKKRNDHRKLTRNFSTSSAIIWRSRRILRNPVDVRPAMQERSECSAQRLDIMFGRCCSKAHHDRRNGCSQAGLARRRRSYELHLNFFESWIGRRCNWEVIGDCGDQIEARLRGLQ